jgi:hypothetical protein
VGLERKRPQANLLIDLPRVEGSRRIGDDVALKGDASLLVCNITVAPVSVYATPPKAAHPMPGAAWDIKLATEIQGTPLQAECLEHALHDRC